MKKQWLIKTLALDIIIMFFSAGFVSSFNIIYANESKPLIKGNTLYVGGSGPNNYTKIQDAINASSDWDTIFVYNGIYYENVLINKCIVLCGENKYDTIIDGGGIGDVVDAAAEGTTIMDFTIQGSGSSDCAGVKVNARFVVIYNNIIINNGDFGILQNVISGINLSTEIYSNLIQGNGDDGIRLRMDDNHVYWNNISENDEGIVIWYPGHHNEIKYNVVKNNYIGIDIFTDSNTIECNTIQDNGEGIEVSYSCSNVITNNIIMNNGRYGIILEYFGDWEEVYPSSSNNIYGNFISGHTYGILLEHDCNDNMILGNNITGNTLGFYADVSDTNMIKQNNFIGNNKSAYYKTYRKYDIVFNHNYWDDLHGASKKIPGKKAIFPLKEPDTYLNFYWFFIPCVKIDSTPAHEPYDIPIGV